MRHGLLRGSGRDAIRAVDLVDRRGHSRSGRRCSQFLGGCFSVPAWPPGPGRRGMAACPGPMNTRRPETGVPPGIAAACSPAAAIPGGVPMLAASRAADTVLTPSGAARRPRFRLSACGGVESPLEVGGSRPAAMFRALPKKFARSGLCGPDCQPKPPPGRPGPGYRADVPMCVPMPGDMGTGNIGTRVLCAAVTRAGSRAARQRPAGGPANPPAGRSAGPPGQQGALNEPQRDAARRVARPAGGRW